ncbi:MAG: ABC transporter substrate-binding protein [Thermoplasmata archaeon]
MNKKSKILATAVILIVLISVVAGVIFFTGTSQGNVIKIGWFGPLTGWAASDGTSSLRGALLAVEQINQSGGINGKKIQLVYYDDQADPTQAVSVVRKLIEQDQVVAIISGSYSGATRAAAPIAQNASIPMVVAYAVHPAITQTGNFIFRTIYLGQSLGIGMAKFAYYGLNARTAAVIWDNIDYGTSISTGFINEFKSLGGNITYQNSFPDSTSDFSAIITQIKSLPKQPDVLVGVSYYTQGGQIVSQARAAGLTCKILGPDGWDSEEFLTVGGNAVNGTYIGTDFARDLPSPIVQNFVNSYKEKYGVMPDMLAASTFDAVHILVNAISSASSTDGNSIRISLTHTQYNGVTGSNITFDQNREVRKPVMILQVVPNSALTPPFEYKYITQETYW